MPSKKNVAKTTGEKIILNKREKYRVKNILFGKFFTDFKIKPKFVLRRKNKNKGNICKTFLENKTKITVFTKNGKL